MGADFIEPDLVTKDGFLVVRHEPMLSGTTNVLKSRISPRKTTKNLDGKSILIGLCLTLPEIKKLKRSRHSLKA
jgi:glycerophosphoryl diester phosphodiesterase